MLVHIIDVDSGNIRSLSNAIKHLGHSVELVQNAEETARVLPSAERVIFPGVGNFGHFMDQLKSRGLVPIVKEYIASGKPLMGICVGLQTLFDGSEESPSSEGLHILPGEVVKFNDSTKSVPHIGWNNCTVHSQTGAGMYTISPASKYYFVHTYARPNNTQFDGWDLATCTYGDETFVAALAKDNLFFTQFHPEKSGQAGLDVINAFLAGEKFSTGATEQIPSKPGLSKRVIACLDVRTNDQGDIVVTKGDQYDVREAGDKQVRNLGKPVEVAQKYYQQGADEVTFLNITSFRDSPLQDQPMVQVLKKASESVFVPLTIGGGIRDLKDPVTGEFVPALEVAHLYFRSGADKVSIGSDAVYAAEQFYANNKQLTGKSPIETISKAYGAQSVIVSIDPKRQYVKSPSDVAHHTFKTENKGPNNEEYVWFQCTVKGGREARDLGAFELAQAVEALGAGELLLNCIDKDGSNSGFDLELVRDIKSAVKIPVIASSGAGNPSHFVEVFEKTNVDAALGAGMFHRNEYSVADVKQAMNANGITTRTAAKPLTLPALTKRLISDPERLTEGDINHALNLILHSEEASEIQIAVFLAAARATGRDHRPDFIATTVANLQRSACHFTPLNSEVKFLDIVGTGGDGRNTFNVSTTSAIVVAGANVARVAKHGGPASTSTSGASDLLSHLGVDLKKVNAKSAPSLLDSNDFVYMSGPVFHPILARVRDVRKNMGIPTIFNLVGPLLNPGPISARVLGVYTPSLGRTYAEAAKLLFKGTRALVVCGAEGLDEISPEGETFVWELTESGDIKEYSVSPSKDFGLPEHPLSEVASGSPAENAATVNALLANELPEGNPIRDYVLLNSAGLLYISGAVSSFKEGVSVANASINNGGARNALEKFKASVEAISG